MSRLTRTFVLSYAPMTYESKLLVACAALALGEAVGFTLRSWADCWPLPTLLAAFSMLLGLAFSWRHAFAAIFFLIGVALAFTVSTARIHLLEQAADSRQPLPIVVTIDHDFDSSAIVTGKHWHSLPCSLGTLRLKVIFQHDGPAPRRGERWAFAGWLQRLDKDELTRRRNFWVRGRGTYARRLQAAPVNTPCAWLQHLRQSLSRRAALGLESAGLAAELNRAILLGERHRLPADTRETFIQAGTIHIFAISGLHVMIVADVLLYLVLFAWCPVRWAGLFTIPALWAYVAITGASPSAVRAAAMATCCHAAPFFWRRPNALVAWSLTFLALHLLRPEQLCDIGSLLSFVVMLAILLANRGFSVLGGSWRSTLCISLAAWAAGVPIAAHVFARITPGGILANLALIPAATVTVTAGVMGMASSYLSETIGCHLNNLSALSTRVMVLVSEAVASLPGANLEVEPWGWGKCLAWYAGLLALLSLAHHRRTIV